MNLARSRFAQGAIALLAGALSPLAYAPFAQAWLILPCLALLCALWREATPRRAAWLGLCWGFGAFFAGVGWLIVALTRYGGMPWPLAALAIALFALYLALFPAACGAAFARLRSGHWGFDAALLGALWAGAEMLRGWLFTGFPWLAIGYTQTPPSPMAGYAPLLGVYGLSALLACASAALALSWGASRRFAAVCAAGLVVLAAGAGLRQLAWTQAQGAALSVALAQLNVPQDLKWDPQRVRDWQALNFDSVSNSRAQLTVLPETSLPTLAEYLPEGYLGALESMLGAQNRQAIVGLFTRDAAGHIYNSAQRLGGGEPSQVYSKNHLVPFGEYSPPLFGWFYQLAKIPMADQRPGGARQALFVIGDQRIALNICYEDLFGEELLHWLPEATLMLNLSNLAWYGDSHAQPQHLQIAQMRALESGRPMLRATNTGMTAWIEPDGRVRAVLPAFVRDTLVLSVRGYQGMTPYAHWGNRPLQLGLAALVLLAVARVRRRALS